MKIIERKVNLENLDSVLERSRVEFIPYEEDYPKFRTRFCLGLLDPDTEIKYFEMSEFGEVCGSFHLVYKQVRMSQETIRVCFLTQVIVSNSFRGQGLAYRIAEYAEKAATEDGAGITFVVARRAVKDLYAKLGFVGFSHFTRISLEKAQRTSISTATKIISPHEEDLQQILEMYEKTYSDLNFFIVRSNESFKNLLKMPNFRVGLSSDKSFYFISTSGEVVEIGMNQNAAKEEVVATLITEGFDSLKLNRNHEISTYAITQNMLCSERFESREGHLLRIHETNLNIMQKQLLERFIRHPGTQRAELLEIDQW
jgi:N-acetylglutamate synthase-like GNAT family acetyltransferase